MSSFPNATSLSYQQVMDKVQKTRKAKRYLVQTNSTSPSKENTLTADSIVMFLNYTHDVFDDGNRKMSCQQ